MTTDQVKPSASNLPVASEAQNTSDGEGQIPQLQGELRRAEDQLKRALADLDNYRKRFDRELSRLHEQEREEILRDLLPVVDNLERALTAGEGSRTPLYMGVDGVHRQLMAVLKRYGVDPIEDIGAQFDPAWHEVIDTVPSVSAEGAIVGIAERGYRVGARPLRHARVVVAGRHD